jgi:hypothetical protein
LRFAGETPSAIWEDWLEEELTGFVLRPAPDGPVNDTYHEYLVTSWWAGLTGRYSFPGTPTWGGLEILRCDVRRGPLRAISEVMYHLGPARCGDWGRMRSVLARSIAAEDLPILDGAARSSEKFPEFFEGFSRAN